MAMTMIRMMMGFMLPNAMVETPTTLPPVNNDISV